MTLSLKYLIAEYLQTNGPQSSHELAARFAMNYKIINIHLGKLRKMGHVEGDGNRAQLWAFVSLPPQVDTKRIRTKILSANIAGMYAGFNRPDLCSVASLPLVRI